MKNKISFFVITPIYHENGDELFLATTSFDEMQLYVDMYGYYMGEATRVHEIEVVSESRIAITNCGFNLIDKESFEHFLSDFDSEEKELEEFTSRINELYKNQ